MIDIESDWDKGKLRSESELLAELISAVGLSRSELNSISESAKQLVEKIRADDRPGLMDVFLAEYGLSSNEGVALMCLAEALLRVPDNSTIDDLIEDKIATSDWSKHIGKSSSPLVNASTWGLMLTGKMLDQSTPGLSKVLHEMIKRLGEPVVRTAVSQAMREMGRQFVLGESINAAMERAQKKEVQGFSYSYDMLGEAAMTMKDARRYQQAYSEAIQNIAEHATAKRISENPGISVKLSALHPRYELAKFERLKRELLPTLKVLARQAARAGIGFNIDAEEQDRLALSLSLIEALLADPELADWDGLGIVVQAYGRRCYAVIDRLYELAKNYDRRIMIRLVKGAYWDTEIKRAQQVGLSDFPVFTNKAATDISFIACARKLLTLSDRVYPQFATHNAHSVSAILTMARELDAGRFEFQRLHGMGEALHDIVKEEHQTQCRIYAPVGTHRDLLAYLVRRLLENGANSSFVNQIVNSSIDAATVAACPFEQVANSTGMRHSNVISAPELFLPERGNSVGYDLSDSVELAHIKSERTRQFSLRVGPLMTNSIKPSPAVSALNPATGERVGEVTEATLDHVQAALASAQSWQAPVSERREVLLKAAALFEAHCGKMFSLLAIEAGKTLPDATSELREAIDFLHYYASQATRLEWKARGVFACISPWNFPLAIFTGQIAAALVAGNAVIAKPAESTPAIAELAVRLLYEAGVPRSALQFLPGQGNIIGDALTSDARIKGVVFTGSTSTARKIQHNIAKHLDPGTPLIAETGGLNTMIVDSTALPEQAVRDIVDSAFRSAGQRCSALRCVYVQEDIVDHIQQMLIGAMDELELGDPWQLSTDIGPVISTEAQESINSYIAQASAEGRLLHQLKAPVSGSFIAPTLLSVNGIEDLEQEIFGPVLHLATFKAGSITGIIDAVNASGYGLTFGLHTRIDSRIQAVANRVQVGNIYANRNQIGAVVGSQPFGGEGLSGTGPKAGGPHYLSRFTSAGPGTTNDDARGETELNALIETLRSHQASGKPMSTQLMPGPTGELNRLSLITRPPALCLGPGNESAQEQKRMIESLGRVTIIVEGNLPAQALHQLPDFSALLWWGDTEQARQYALALADLPGAIVPLITDTPDQAHVVFERHLCVDTTAAGGNVSLLAAQ